MKKSKLQKVDFFYIDKYQAIGVIGDLIDKAVKIKTYVIGSIVYKREDKMDVIGAISDLIFRADDEDEMCFFFSINYTRRMVYLNIPILLKDFQKKIKASSY